MQVEKQIEPDSVKKSIMDSFAMSRYPGDSRLTQLSPDDDPDSSEIFQVLRSKTWQDLLARLEETHGPDLYWYSSIYTLLTPESFCYFLPAFLITAMDLVRADVAGGDLIYILTLYRRPEFVTLKQYVANTVSLLSWPQRQAVQYWLRYLLQQYPDLIEVSALDAWL